MLENIIRAELSLKTCAIASVKRATPISLRKLRKLVNVHAQLTSGLDVTEDWMDMAEADMTES